MNVANVPINITAQQYKQKFIKHDRQLVFTTCPNADKRVENIVTTRNGKCLRNFNVFGNVMNHCLDCLIYLLNRDYN